MKKSLATGLAGLLLMVAADRCFAQGRPSGVYSQTIGPGALTPNGRTAAGSYGYGLGFGRGFYYNRGMAYGSGPVYGGGLGNYYGSGITTARPSGVTWYSVAGGYSTAPQTGLPWRNGGPRTDWGRAVSPDSPVEGLARSRTVTGRDYSLATKLARARLSADKSSDSTAVPVSSRRVETDDKKDATKEKSPK